MNERPAHIGQIPPEQVYAYLHTSPEGLGSAEVTERLAHIGPNRFEIIDRWKLLRSLGRQFTNFFAILLFLSAIVTSRMGIFAIFGAPNTRTTTQTQRTSSL